MPDDPISSPMTVEGVIVTNGIMTSCFSQIESHAVQKVNVDECLKYANINTLLPDFSFPSIYLFQSTRLSAI